MELKDFTIETLDNPILKEIVTENGTPLNGQFFIGMYMLHFKAGLLDSGFDTFADPRPAVEGPGYIEYRNNGVLTNPKDNVPARSYNGFSVREFWENGKRIIKDE